MAAALTRSVTLRRFPYRTESQRIPIVSPFQVSRQIQLQLSSFIESSPPVCDRCALDARQYLGARPKSANRKWPSTRLLKSVVARTRSYLARLALPAAL